MDSGKEQRERDAEGLLESRSLRLGYRREGSWKAVVQEVADRVFVLCEGRMVEQQSTADLFREPRHPYTRALIGACPQW